MRIVRVFTGLMAGLLCAGPALGGLITTAGFEDNSLGPLHGQGGGANWATNWSASETATKFARVEDNTYITPQEGSQHVHFYGTANMVAYRQFQAGQEPGEDILYCQFYIQFANDMLSDAFRVEIGDSDGDVTNDMKKVHVSLEGDGGIYQFISNSEQVLLDMWDGSTGLPDAGTQYVQFEVWADRTNMTYDVSYGGTQIANDLPWRITSDDNVLDRLRFEGCRSGDLDPSLGGPYVDDIRIEGIPEPGSLIAWIFATGFLMPRRRR